MIIDEIQARFPLNFLRKQSLENDFRQAQKEFLSGTEESAKAMAQMNFELSITEAYKSEAEFLITRAVLQ